MQKVYCDFCNNEMSHDEADITGHRIPIEKDGAELTIEISKVRTHRPADSFPIRANTERVPDICGPCLLLAITKELAPVVNIEPVVHVDFRDRASYDADGGRPVSSDDDIPF